MEMVKLSEPLRCHALYDVKLVLLVIYTTEPASTLSFYLFIALFFILFKQYLFIYILYKCYLYNILKNKMVH